MAFKPTKAQQRAIEEKGSILVSAAAGSGKTAVLVERVISQLCDKENPTRADELLIVTFTNAAAAEMRSRIENRLEEECRKHPNDTALLLQKHLLSNAKICTIDSFCIDLVRENFEKLDISPDFKIGDSSTLESINQEVLFSILNRYLEEKDPLFFELLDIVGAEFDEKNFAQLVLSVYEYSRQLPSPQVWFNKLLKDYDNGVFSKNNIWYKYTFQKARKIVDAMQSQISTAKYFISTIEEASNAYYAAFDDASMQISALEDALTNNDWDEFYNALSSYKLMRLPSVRGLSEFSLINAAKDIYKYLGSKACENLQKLFYGDFEFINCQFLKLYKPLELFVDILKEFDTKVFEAYKEQNIFTFHNTEHLALKLLCSERDGVLTVADEAKELLSQYKEVMVDEFQDTNDLQNRLFYILSEFDSKLFVVGDVKQSIYAFRGANPLNFLEKKNNCVDACNATQNERKKIILGNNFRSKDEICSFVNYFFKLFMQEETGNIIYNSEEELIPASVFPQIDEKSVSADIIDCCDSNEESLILEARAIAEYIKKTINGKECIKKDENTLRKACYGDFTILLRSVSNKAPLLVRELKKCGIPVALNVSEFAESVEIATFLSLLKVIDNPQSDIELLTVMMSPIFSFTPDEMAEIRADKKDGDLYSAVIFSANRANLHCKSFLNTIEKYRLEAVTLSLSDLISKLLISTEYLNISSAMSDGEQRRNNLLLLCDLAEQFSTEKSPSITSFISFVQKQTQSIGSNVSGGNSVKIMSIHASKGLQFPICIIASAASKFNDAESRNSAAFSTDFGLGFKYFDEQDKQKYTTVSREVILDNIKNFALEEELRLLYVAMTRAQDKLHFVASYSNLDRALKGYKNLAVSSENKVDYALFSRTKSYADWLMISFLLHPDGKKLLDGNDGILCRDTQSTIDIKLIDASTLVPSYTEKEEETIAFDNEFSELLNRNFSYSYPYADLEKIQSKMSVSALANKAESEKYYFKGLPSFLSKDGITATGRGTAMHKVMQFIDFTKSNQVEEEIERLYEWQFITEAEKNALSIRDLKAFFESEIFARIKNSQRVEREMRFITEIPACEIDATLGTVYKDEQVIVQGAVDICFIEDGGLVILDFKTDRVEALEQLAESYGEQLSIYAKACEKIFGLPTKEKIIYSFAKSDTVSIK